MRSTSGTPTSGKSSFGLEQLRGLSLVANPPARISPFKHVDPDCERNVRGSKECYSLYWATLRHARLASMQSGENGSLATVNRRSRERKGLEAIFTSHKDGMKLKFFTG